MSVSFIEAFSTFLLFHTLTFLFKSEQKRLRFKGITKKVVFDLSVAIIERGLERKRLLTGLSCNSLYQFESCDSNLEWPKIKQKIIQKWPTDIDEYRSLFFCLFDYYNLLRCWKLKDKKCVHIDIWCLAFYVELEKKHERKDRACQHTYRLRSYVIFVARCVCENCMPNEQWPGNLSCAHDRSYSRESFSFLKEFQ